MVGTFMRRHFVVMISAALAVAIAAPAAWAGYWDFSGNLANGAAYSEAVPFVSSYSTRLSRATAGPKVRLFNYNGTTTLPPCFPGPNDCRNGFSGFNFFRSQCENNSGATVFVNCRIDATI